MGEEMFEQFLDNFLHNLFKPLLLFFYLGFLVPLLKVPFEFPYAVYAAAVAGYYGSDSAGTFVTCLGVLTASNIAFAAYMPVMLAVMEIPGCLVALALVARMRASGKMDALGNMPGEAGYDPHAIRLPGRSDQFDELDEHKDLSDKAPAHRQMQEQVEPTERTKTTGILSKRVLHEVFLNSGLYLLFGGILIGFISGLQGAKVTAANDVFFVQLFPAILCLFLIEMGMTACKRLQGLRTA